jgi:hypothetical protein
MRTVDGALYPRCDLFARPPSSITRRLGKHTIERDYLLIAQKWLGAGTLLLLPLDSSNA